MDSGNSLATITAWNNHVKVVLGGAVSVSVSVMPQLLPDLPLPTLRMVTRVGMKQWKQAQQWSMMQQMQAR